MPIVPMKLVIFRLTLPLWGDVILGVHAICLKIPPCAEFWFKRIWEGYSCHAGPGDDGVSAAGTVRWLGMIIDPVLGFDLNRHGMVVSPYHPLIGFQDDHAYPTHWFLPWKICRLHLVDHLLNATVWWEALWWETENATRACKPECVPNHWGWDFQGFFVETFYVSLYCLLLLLTNCEQMVRKWNYVEMMPKLLTEFSETEMDRGTNEASHDKPEFAKSWERVGITQRSMHYVSSWGLKSAGDVYRVSSAVISIES